MKFISFTINGQSTYGVVKDVGVIDLGVRLSEQGFPTLRSFLAGGDLRIAERLISSEQPDFAVEGLSFAPVIPDPDKIICVGMNYREHAAEVGRTIVDKPSLFARFAGSQVGHLQPMIKPKVSDQFDYEGELAVVIGRAGRHILAVDAFQHIAGYACYNEGSVRDWQRHSTQFLAGKTFAGTGAFGPWLVTRDEITDPRRLTLETRVNGTKVQHTSVGEMIFDIPALIAYCSAILPLLPGDVIVTGTPAGVGARRTPPLFLNPGDIVDVEVDGVGLLRNSIELEK